MTPKPVAGRSFLGTMVLVLLAIAALFAADMFLAGMERAETGVEAARLFQQGQALMQLGKNAEAINRIEDAILIERGNRDYRRTLAQAQLAAGMTANAEATLTELLQNDSSDGFASKLMGRALVKEGRFAEAISYLHRAIYGQWDEDAAENRLRVRYELIDLLAKRNSKEELLAELLSVQDQAPRDLKTQLRMGRLFLVAGSPARAADVFREILHDAPTSADAYAGLGDSDFARGNYRAAQRDFQTTIRLAPNNQASLQRLDICNQLLLLDPTVRGLGQSERFRRSVKLVELGLTETSQCVDQHPSPDLELLLDKAGKALKAHVTAAHQNEESESNVDLAEQLWQARKKECKAPLASDSPLALVLAKLAQ
ncbi:MAG: tetratricopeptide repeat protein [Acidobacteriia bacterium]|nr:tetratricopeptide repeat protein [Terriglobia bacterium]